MRAGHTRTGRWGIQQLCDDRWASCTIWCGYEGRADAEAEVERMNARQPGHWRIFDRRTT